MIEPLSLKSSYEKVVAMSHETNRGIQKAVLVGIQLPKMDTAELNSSLHELSRLVTTLGYQVVGQVSQKRNSTKSAQLLGDGKLKELAGWTGGSGKIASLVDRKKSKAALKWEAAGDEDSEEESELYENSGDDSEEDESVSEPREKADYVIVDCDLSPSQLRNLESATGVPVLDRTGVIIEIFSRHAKTKTARLQVEIARLAYLAPRMREANMGGDDREGGGGKGVGESALELDKRKIRDRIKELKIELAAISNEHDVRRAHRSQEITVALVGYTNAGKSSLMRALTGSEILVADKLFATLDTTIRPLYPESRPKILISDTVGFIKKLPHDLVASFKSTLDEALHASLLLYVVDCSDPSFRSQLEVTQKVLAEVGVGDAPFLLILNKRDMVSPEEQHNLQVEFPGAILISTRSKDDLKHLREKILSYFETDMVDSDLFIPYLAQSAVIGELRSRVRVLSESYDEKGVTVRIRAAQDVIEDFQKKIKSQSKTIR
jgi:GTP-binding protein HflX